jgi:putative ABC transport system permease protein
MIKFLLKGIVRDRNRSLLPIIVIAIGVFLTVFLSAWLKGVFTDMIDVNANFNTGHVKVATRAYFESTQAANDLALLDVDELLLDLKTDFPTMDWVKRIKFGGLLDVADDQGETRAQGTAAGQAVDLFSSESREPERMNILQSIVQGRLPSKPGEALISEDFAARFNIRLGETVTLFGATMYGSMMFYNFTVAGTVRFGNQQLDRGAIIIDVADAQIAMDMNDAAGEILGFDTIDGYDKEEAGRIKMAFNSKYELDDDEFVPQMQQLKDQNGLDEYLVLIDSMGGIMTFVFVMAMSVVLWNTGLLGGLRRYNEFGIRLALGEEKRHIFRTLIYEAVLIGFIGSVVGTIFGILAAYYLQEHGFDFGNAVQGSVMMMPTVFRTMVTPEAFYIGFIPGLFSMVVGNALSGIAIYKRKTAQLFKELEV